MMVIFSLILALALLVGIIYILRRHQERTRQDVVAREQPLPPLARETPPVTGTAPPRSVQPPVAPAPPGPASSIDGALIDGPLIEEASTVEPSQVPDSPADWRQRCQQLRDQGYYAEALATCQQAWPQWQSFDLAARVLRAAIRSEQKNSEAQQLWLHRLYTLAAQASFLHDKVDGMPEPTRQLLTQHFEPEQVDRLDMPWSEIGYRELRLLTKSDRKLLTQMLGEPSAHQSARIFHDKQWLTAIS